MEIKVGYYKTRDGRKARVICTDAPGGAPVVGYIIGETSSGYVNIRKWCVGGEYYSTGSKSDHDLIAEWVEPLELWVNVYGNHQQQFNAYDTKMRADDQQSEGCIRTVHMREVVDD